MKYCLPIQEKKKSKILLNTIFDTGICFSWHRRLCHSLVHSELRSTVDGQRSTKDSLAQECDATKAQLITNAWLKNIKIQTQKYDAFKIHCTPIQDGR